MKALLSNTVAYSGAVELSLRTGPSIVKVTTKNTGTRYLANALAASMCGYDISKQLPAYLDVVDSSGKSCLLRRLPLTGKVWGEVAGGDGSCLFNSVILNEDVNPSSKDLGYAVHLLSYEGEALATISGSVQEMLRSVSDSTDGLVSWKMTFKTGGENK